MVRIDRLLLTVYLLVMTSVIGTSGIYTVIDGIGMYRVGTAAVDGWSVAFDACSLDGPYAHLAIINSEEEAEALQSFVADYTFDFYYVGFSNLLGQQEFATVQGTPLKELGYSLWYNHGPSDVPTAVCGTVTRFIELSNQECAQAYSYICEMPLWTTYDYVKDVGYYKFYTDGKTWQEAVKTCKGDGAELLVVESLEEHALVTELLEEHPFLPNTDNPNTFHYGVHDFYLDNRPVTIQGIPFVVNATGDPIIWGPGEPASSSVANSAVLTRGNELYMSDPTYRLAFICER